MSTISQDDLSYLFRHDFFHARMVEALMVGMYTSIVLFTIYKIASERGLKPLIRPYIVLMVVMYGCTVYNLAMDWRLAKLAFIDNGHSTLAATRVLARRTIVEIVTQNVTQGAVLFIGDYIMISRCWELYGRSLAVIAVPAVLLLGELVFLVFRTVIATPTIRGKLSSTALNSTIILVHISFTLATTIIATLLIVYRIIRMGGLQKYLGIISVVVESAALYAITMIVYIVLTSAGGGTITDIIPRVVLVLISGIASTLIIARVVLGQSIEHTISDKNATATKWGRGGYDGNAPLHFQHSALSGAGHVRGSSHGYFSNTLGIETHSAQAAEPMRSPEVGTLTYENFSSDVEERRKEVSS